MNQKKVYAVQISVCMLLFIIGMLLSLNSKAQQQNVRLGNFYAVTGKGLRDTSWIFGTYHLVKSSYLDEVPAVMDAFNKSKGVVVELVIDSAKLPAAYAMGMLKGNKLSDLLDKPFKDSLEKEVKTTLGVGMNQIDQLKPINVALALALVYIITDTSSPIQKYSGVLLDGFFAATGKKSGKKITELETIEEQMDVLFNKSSNQEQVNQLKLFLRNKTEMIQQSNDLINSWFSHDLNKMQAVSDKGFAVFGNENELLKNRNDKWIKTLPGLLAKETQFIAVGALHLAGPFGLVKQLEQLGYTVTPVKL